MRRLFFSLLAATIVFLLPGCYDTTEEVTLNSDGTGTVSYTNDMSALIAMAKQMGGTEQMKKAGKDKIDSTISLLQMADSIPNFTELEKEMLKTGSLNINMDLDAEKFLTKLVFPFSDPGNIAQLDNISAKIMGETLKGEMKNGMGGGDVMPEMTKFNDYFTVDFSNGSISRKLNKEKYETAAEDEFLKGMKETATMGLAMKSVFIINLPKPASKLEGKGAILSDDKMKVTISADINDFFDNPELLEFKITY